MQVENHYLKVVDNRLDAWSDNKVDYVFKEGAQNIAYVPIQSSSHSNQSTNFALNNIGTYNVRDSRLVLTMPVTVSISVTNSTAGALSFINADNFGYRQFPLNSCIQNNTHIINQASYSLNTSEILNVISRVCMSPEDMNFYENTMPDLISSYANAQGTSLSPISSYTSNLEGDGVWKPRTVGFSISGNVIPAQSTQTVTISCQLYEPLIDPFTNISSVSKPGLFGITGEQVQITYVPNLFNNMFSLGAIQTGLTYTTPAVNLGPNANTLSNATLFCVYLTPYDHMIPYVPKESVIPYNNYQYFTSAIGAVAPGQTISFASQVATVTNMPAKFIIAAVPNLDARSASLPNVYLTTGSVSVSIDNGQPQLSSANGNQLFDISRESGLQMSRQAFLGQTLNTSLNASDPTNNPVVAGCGSVLVLEPSQLGIKSGLAEGSVGRFIFQILNMTLTNNTGANISGWTLYIIAVNNAVLHRRGTEYTNYLLNAPDNITRLAQNLPVVSRSQYQHALNRNAFLSGSGIKDFFRKAFGTLKDAAKYVAPIAGPMVVGHYTKKLLGGSKHKGGAREVQPPHDMDLFFE